MCNVPVIFSAISAVVGGVSSFADNAQSMEAARRANEYNAAVARNNTAFANEQAKYIQSQGEKKLEEERDERSSILGKIKALRSSSGVTLSGSPTDSLISEERSHQYNVENIKDDVARQVWEQKSNANNYMNSASYTASKSTGSMLGGLRGLFEGVGTAYNELHTAAKNSNLFGTAKA